MMKKKSDKGILFLYMGILGLICLRIIFSLFSSLKEGTIDSSILNINARLYSSLLTIIIAILFGPIVGWYIQRSSFLKENEINDQLIFNVIKHLGPIMVLAIIISISVFSSSLQQYTWVLLISVSLIETIQFWFLSILFGIIGFNVLETYLGPIFYGYILQPSKNSLGISLIKHQFNQLSSDTFKPVLLLLSLLIAVANLVVLLIYPSIPSENLEYLFFAIPNFNYKFTPSDAFKQELFKLVYINPRWYLNYKIVQSLMSILLFSFMALMIYIKNKREVQKDSNLLTAKREKDMGDVIYNILAPVKRELYQPQSKIKKDNKNKIKRFLEDVKESTLLSVIKLCLINTAISYVIIVIGLLLGFPVQIIGNLGDRQISFLNLSLLVWAGFSEEVTFRFLLFGLPLFMIKAIPYAFRRWIINSSEFDNNLKNDPKVQDDQENIQKMDITPFQEKRRNSVNPLLYLTGGWKKLGIIDLFFLLVSSFLFGFVHYQVGTWLPWKIVQTAFGGLIMGIAFYKYGLHAAIFVHVVNNFVIGLITTLNYGLITIGILSLIIIIFLGLLYSLIVFNGFISNYFLKIYTKITNHDLEIRNINTLTSSKEDK